MTSPECRVDAVRGADQGRPRPTLSFVVPAYNESENIEPLARRIVSSCEEAGIADFEVVFVENGSYDDSAALLRRLHQADSRLKMIQLSRNFGYQGAITAGLHYVSGEWVAVIDGDQQDPPELIPQMLAKAREGYDVVYGVRRTRQEGPLQRAFYKAFYRLWRMTASIDIPVDASEFAVMHRRVVDILNGMPERQRFNRGLRAWTGFRQTGLDYARSSRAAGATKFSLLGNVSLAMDGLFAFSIVPIRLTMLVGLVVTSVSLLIAGANTAFWIAGRFHPALRFGRMAEGLTQTNLVLSILSGVILLCLGVVGEYVGRIFEEVKKRPHFIVRDELL